MIRVKYSNVLYIDGLTEKQLEQVKDELTIVNPKYLSAMKYSNNINYISINKYIFYYEILGQTLIAPQGYILPFKYTVVKDTTCEKTVFNFPKFNLKLRDIQIEAYNSYIQDTNKGIISLPTGSGKSNLGLYIAHRLKQRTLIIVHKDDLLTGWQKDIEKTFNGVIKAGIIKAQKYTIEKYFTITTIQTLSRMDISTLEDTLSYFGILIVDEMHHIPASTFSLINYFSGAYRIGLSATVERNDGMEKLFNLYLGGFGYKFDKSKSTKDVLPAKVCIATVPIVYIPTVIKNSKGKYIECEEDTPHCIPIDKIAHKLKPHVHFMELENHVIRNPIFANKICTDIVHEYRKGRSIVIFFNQKAHCLEYYEGLIQYYNIPEKDIQIYYGDSEESNDVLLGRAESKEVKITLTTYKKANEGTNVKAWEVCFLASSINNGMGVQQTTGRIRRSNSNKINPVLVYDYSLPNVYTIGKHIYTRIRRYMELKYKVINR